MTDSDIYWTFTTANTYSSGFYGALARAGLKADPRNKQRILAAFPEMYDAYGPANGFHRQLRGGVAA